ASRHFEVNGSGFLRLEDLTLSGGLSPSGGSIYVAVPTASLSITRSTIAGNSASSSAGGGLWMQAGTATIVNSTFSGNHSVSTGGAFYMQSGTLNLTNVTAYGNTAAASGSTLYMQSGTVNVNNTIFAEDPAAAVPLCAILGGTISGGNNLAT